MNRNIIITWLAIITLTSCNNTPVKNESKDALSSWKDGFIKTEITNFVKRDTLDIPIKERIAVFDMDGTVVCESPLWFEMYCAVAKLHEAIKKDATLLKNKTYQMANALYKNPANSMVHASWVTREENFIDSMVWKAFEGEDHEDYVDYCTQYLNTTINSDKDMILGDMFYKPMLELITYLQNNHYQVYIVSGSVQGVIWSIIPEKTSIKERSHLIGTRQILEPNYDGNVTKFRIKKGIFTPKNNHNGKTDNIYSQLGVQPVFAFGNTTGDFEMLQYAITNKHQGMAFMLNHDDAREYIYPPYYSSTIPNWRNDINSFGGVIVSMKDNFKDLW